MYLTMKSGHIKTYAICNAAGGRDMKYVHNMLNHQGYDRLYMYVFIIILALPRGFARLFSTLSLKNSCSWSVAVHHVGLSYKLTIAF